MGLDRVLDGEFMEVELARDRGELLLARFVQTEPRDRIPGLQAACSSAKSSGAATRRPSR